ncbi:hypothetical protein J1N35_026720 [Gossypium stocksii]|uniref:Uncharacterized protein n=1 Tax=Gossypium stocksii TaxID=47602 RepID=A0A9D3V8T4_9ROSI|nr:hypothetical protein J1N35_026720 [Gossypium stocksii]
MACYLLHRVLCSSQRDLSFQIWMPRHSFNRIGCMHHDTRTARDVWNTATRHFATITSAKLSRIRHDLHSLKKGNLSITEYVTKIQNTCALIEASGFRISKAEKVEVILTGLPLKFNAVRTLASFSTETLSFQHLVDVLLECETQLARAVQELPIQANFVEFVPSSSMVDPSRGGRSSYSDCGKGFRNYIQC